MKGYYATLIKPSFAPAPWVYSIVWPIMYLLMGLAAYRIWMNRKLNIKAMRGLTYYLIQLFFNFVWSIVFFGMKLQMVSVICIFLLLGLVMITTKAFAKVDKKARNLMIPYVLWTMFATVLNVSIWYLNM